MSRAERLETMQERAQRLHPWHSPPHFHSDTTEHYLFTAACFDHLPIVGSTRVRLTKFEGSLLEVASKTCSKIHAWVVLPNHYHFLAQTFDCLVVLRELGLLHGGTSYHWNGEEGTRGRQVWFNATETAMKSDGHFWATMNYVHHNPVKHGYVTRWQDWPFSSAHQYLAAFGEAEATRIWREYPIKDYGKGWDD